MQVDGVMSATATPAKPSGPGQTLTANITNRAAMKALRSAFSDIAEAEQEHAEIEELEVEF